MFKLSSFLCLWLISSLSYGGLWSYGAAFVVLMGVVGETITELTNWIKPECLKSRVAKISALVLIVGLTGDLLGIRETQIEVAVLIKEAGDARSSAGGAALAASGAKASAQEALLAADKVKEKMEILAKQADGLTGRVERASGKLNSLEEQFRVQGPRWQLLENNKTTFIELLKPFAGQRFTVVGCGPISSTEPYKLEQDLLNFLGEEGAGWVMASPGYARWSLCTNGATSVGGNLVTFSSTSDKVVQDSAKALGDALNKLAIGTITIPAIREGQQQRAAYLGVDSPWELATKDPTAVILLVGTNPMFDLAGWRKRKK